MVCSAQQAGPQKTQKMGHSNTSLLFAKDPNFCTRPTEKLETRELFFKMMLSVLLVVGLGAGAIYFSKKLLPRITNLPGKKVRIVETVHLGPRKAVHLLQIGNQQILIGSTNEGITKLADIDTLSQIGPPETSGDNN